MQWKHAFAQVCKQLIHLACLLYALRVWLGKLILYSAIKFNYFGQIFSFCADVWELWQKARRKRRESKIFLLQIFIKCLLVLVPLRLDVSSCI